MIIIIASLHRLLPYAGHTAKHKDIQTVCVYIYIYIYIYIHSIVVPILWMKKLRFTELGQVRSLDLAQEMGRFLNETNFTFTV